MLKKLRQVLLTVLPTVIYAHLDFDNEQNAEPPFIIYQEISKRPPSYGDDKPVYYLRTIQITLLTKKQAEEQDKILTDNINKLFEGKTFTSDYARNGLLNDIKAGLNNPENKGKGIQDLFNELTKDKTDIFANPNQIKDMAGIGDSEQDNNIKEMPLIW